MEYAVELTVSNKAKAAGWYVRKLKWIGRMSAPDRFFAKDGRVVLIEFKDKGKRPSTLQEREHIQLHAAGVECHVVDNVADGLRVLGVA